MIVSYFEAMDVCYIPIIFFRILISLNECIYRIFSTVTTTRRTNFPKRIRYHVFKCFAGHT